MDLLGLLLVYLLTRKEDRGPSLPPSPGWPQGWPQGWPGSAPLPSVPLQQGETIFHQIVQGDTLYGLASRYNALPTSILQANPWLTYDPGSPAGARPWSVGSVVQVPTLQRLPGPAAPAGGAGGFPWQSAPVPPAPPMVPTMPPGWPSPPLPGPIPATSWPTPATGLPVGPPRPWYKIRNGDFASGLAKRATGDGGRWRELLEANAELSTFTAPNGSTQIRPWKVGQKLYLPSGWEKIAIGIDPPRVLQVGGEEAKAAGGGKR